LDGGRRIERKTTPAEALRHMLADGTGPESSIWDELPTSKQNTNLKHKNIRIFGVF
jgi:hypothetical protein